MLTETATRPAEARAAPELDEALPAIRTMTPLQPVTPGAAVTPSRLLMMAVQQGADLDRLERLMSLQERWEANEARKAFVAAMAEFKSEPLDIFKRKAVGFETKDGEWVGYKHAELSDVAGVIVPALARHGMSHRWDIRQEGGRVHVICTVTHRLGHSESVTMDAAPDNSGKKNAIQQVASAITYCQRYTLLAITGLSTKGLDDDGRGSDGLDPEADAGGAGGRSGTPTFADQAEEPKREQPGRDGYPEERFVANLADWRSVISSGRKTADQLIAWLDAKHPLTDSQKKRLREKA